MKIGLRQTCKFLQNGEECTVSPRSAKMGSKTSVPIEPPHCPEKFDNLDDFFSRVTGQIKRAQSPNSSAEQSSSKKGKISDIHKSPPSAEMLAMAKEDIKRLLILPSQDLLLPGNCSSLSVALSTYAASPEFSGEKALVFEKFEENLPHLSLTSRRAKKDQDEYYKKAVKKALLVDELTKGEELYANLKDCDNKLKASLEDIKAKRKAIQEQKVSLAKKCFKNSTALDEMDAEFPNPEETKKLADMDIANVEESLSYFKSKIFGLSGFK